MIDLIINLITLSAGAALYAWARRSAKEKAPTAAATASESAQK